MKVKEYTNIQNYIEIKKNKILKNIENILPENDRSKLINCNGDNFFKKPKRAKKDNSKKGDVFLNCRCCGVSIRPDWYSNLDKRYCQDCL